ncbi:hypothetical protein IV203_030748 [Nitzschia inconspicua]|uniref:Uncharacterized protein n=1 Tax=Nitzschia inconspicua TaxID=303405 RepID=A0A9K3Q2H1_9STRA|nr:hypothetical protein IV203_030748 [Nitzschia inconspicua]
METVSIRFKTVLSARNNDESPSDLEREFRSVSDRVKVVTKHKLSGAHFHCVKERLAIRAYYPCDLEALPPLSKDGNDFDGLNGFLRSFQLAIVLFVLPVHEPIFQQQLSDITLHFHRAQRLVGNLTMESADKNMRVLLVPDTQSAMENLISIANSVTPHVKEKKRDYFLRLHEKFLVPKQVPQPGGLPSKLAIPEAYAVSGSCRVMAALEHLGAALELPEKEEHALIAFLGNLENIAQADDAVFHSLPFLDRTKKLVQAFFGNAKNGVDNEKEVSERSGMPSLLYHPPISMARHWDREQPQTPPPPDFPDESVIMVDGPFDSMGVSYPDPFVGTPHSNEIHSPQEFGKWSPRGFACFEPRNQDRLSSSNRPRRNSSPWYTSHQRQVSSYQPQWPSDRRAPPQERFSTRATYFKSQQPPIPPPHSRATPQERFSTRATYFKSQQPPIPPPRSREWSQDMASFGERFSRWPPMNQDQNFEPARRYYTPPRHALSPPRMQHSYGRHPNSEPHVDIPYQNCSYDNAPSSGISRFQRREHSDQNGTSYSQAPYPSYRGAETSFSANPMRR